LLLKISDPRNHELHQQIILYKLNFLIPLSLIRSTRLILKYARKFIAGFISVPSFAIGKLAIFPPKNLLIEERTLVEQDRFEVMSDMKSAQYKNKTKK